MNETQWVEWQSSNGLIIKVRAVQPLIISKVVTSVKMPPAPTYEVKTLSGKIEHHPYDEEVARQTPGGLALWTEYVEELKRAQMAQNEKVANALFVFGTQIDNLPSGWEDMHRAAGLDVPEEVNARRAYYLSTELNAVDIAELIKQIMKLSGVSEEEIKESTDSF